MKISKSGKKYVLDFRFRDGRFRLVAFEDEKASRRLSDTVERLMDISYNNDVMPLDLQRAIDCMPPRIVRKLGTIGILSAARTAGKNRLEDHLGDFVNSLAIKRPTRQHLAQTKKMLKRVFADCRFNVISDLDPDRFIAFINGLNTAAKTKKHYTALMKQFAQWLHDTGRLPKNHFRLIKAPKVLQADQVHPRRALSADEVARLIHAAETGESWWSISGRERALIYRLAVESGLRLNEIRTLKTEDFDFVRCTVTVQDSNEKARRGATLPLRAATAALIQDFLGNKTPQARAFTVKKGSLMIQVDLKKAGIPYEIDGKYCDFHSLRHSTASLLIQTGANIKTVQTIMRHTTAELTLQKYSHLYAGQQRETIESLPDFQIQQAEAVKTGTDDREIAQNLLPKNCQNSANRPENNRTIPNNSKNAEMIGKGHFEAIEGQIAAFSGEKLTPLISGENWAIQDSNL